jgi:hypothetical protein
MVVRIVDATRNSRPNTISCGQLPPDPGRVSGEFPSFPPGIMRTIASTPPPDDKHCTRTAENQGPKSCPARLRAEYPYNGRIGRCDEFGSAADTGSVFPECLRCPASSVGINAGPDTGSRPEEPCRVSRGTGKKETVQAFTTLTVRNTRSRFRSLLPRNACRWH